MRLATTDELTRLASRRRLSQLLDQAWQRGVRDGTAVGLLMLDVDCSSATTTRADTR